MFLVSQEEIWLLLLSGVVVVFMDPPSVCFYKVTLHPMECY